MKIVNDYFDAYRFFEQSEPTETLVWENPNSTGLAEICEMSQGKGYSYRIETKEKYYSEPICMTLKVRSMVFAKIDCFGGTRWLERL